jgi:hypothetical protein
MVSPSPICLVRVHSRWRCRRRRSTGCRSGRLVPPLWFCTTPTVFSANEFRAYCIPVPEGVRSVSTTVDHSSSARKQVPPDKSGGRWRSGRIGHFPDCAFTPLEEVPPSAAVPHRCGRCPLVVVPPSWTPLPVTSSATLDLEALLRCRVRSDCRRCQRAVALSFHGLRSPPGFLGRYRPSPRCVSASTRKNQFPSFRP